LLGLACLFTTVACTPEEIAVFAEASKPYHDVISDDGLHRLRMCESTDNYGAVDRFGKYRGAYQFDQRTWDGVASRHFEWLVGVDPAVAHPAWQDLMARALYSERGAAPWPVCSKRMNG
jgi:hypothetical protein